MIRDFEDITLSFAIPIDFHRMYHRILKDLHVTSTPEKGKEKCFFFNNRLLKKLLNHSHTTS